MKKLIALMLTAVALVGANSGDGENRVVRVINRSSHPIHYLHASNVQRTSWESDILGRGRVLMPGYQINVNIDDGTGHCLYDLRAVLSDGRQAITRRVNVCTQATWTVTD